MITREINFICDGEGVMGRVVDGCHSQLSGGTWEHDSARDAWLAVRARGWHEARWQQATKHLCPVCWEQFLLERKGR